jgi:hypothetical protein
MKAKRRCIPNFEARSVMLFAACALGTAMGAHAQTPDSPTYRPAYTVAQSTIGPAATTPSAGTQAPGAAAGGTNTAEAAAFARADKDRDGKLSRAEAEQLPAVSQRFDQLDTNKDNFLSRDEFDKGVKS